MRRMISKIIVYYFIVRIIDIADYATIYPIVQLGVTLQLCLWPLLFCYEQFEKMRPHLKKCNLERNLRPGLFPMCIALSGLKKMRFRARNVRPGLFFMFIAFSDACFVKIVL